MTTYERMVDGRVVERVTPVPGDHEDTRLGCAVLDGTGGWRVQGAEAEQTAPADPPGGEPSTDTTTRAEPTPRVGPRRADKDKKEA